MKKISRKIFHDNISDADAVKALALLIFIKNHFPTSVVPNFSYYKIVSITGLHYNTVKKRINTLADMELIEAVGKYNQHLKFKRVRAKNSNVNFSRIDTSSVKLIEKGLRALFLVEKVNQKNYVEQRVILAQECKNGKERKAGQQTCKKCGSSDFKDNGISYAYLAKKLNVSLNVVSEVTKYAVSAKLVIKHKTIQQISYVKGEAKNALIVFNEVKGFFATKNNIYKVGCNKYSLFCSDVAVAK